MNAETNRPVRSQPALANLWRTVLLVKDLSAEAVRRIAQDLSMWGWGDVGMWGCGDVGM
jgi:hypothetical protein